MSEDSDDIAEFSQRCYRKIGEAGNELRQDGKTRGLSRVEIAVTIVCACVRLQAIAMFGADIDSAEFDGLLQQNLDDLKRRYVNGLHHAEH